MSRVESKWDREREEAIGVVEDGYNRIIWYRENQ